MKQLMLFAGLAIGVLGLVTTTAPRATAGPITYTETATATGLLGADFFRDALVTITATNNTANVINPISGVYVVPGLPDTGTLTVTVAGVGAAVFRQDNLIDLILSQTGQSVGFVDTIGFFTILGANNPAFATYDLETSFGPVSGPALWNAINDVFDTTAGLFEIRGISGQGTFQASTIPEPSTMTLTGIGSLGLLFFSRWRRPARAVA